MPNLKAKIQSDFELHWRGMLSDYVTAIAWSHKGEIFAASSASGEVVLYYGEKTKQAVSLQTESGESVNCLVFSRDGQFLAAGGQSGSVLIWRLNENNPKLVSILGNKRDWVDRMAWSPTKNQLAFGLGQVVQVWDAQSDIKTTLNFGNSSVLDITWHPNGESLAVAGYQGIKIWMVENWDDEPSLLPVDSASLAIAWSGDGKYIASGNIARTITVLESNNPAIPWVMQGLPGKIRCLGWSDTPTKSGVPLLAASSLEGIVVWEKDGSEWDVRALSKHENIVQSIQFQPNSHLLASVGADGRVCLWNKGRKLTQFLDGADGGLSCLSWHPQGHQFAVGGNNGELIIWSRGMRGLGFGA